MKQQKKSCLLKLISFLLLQDPICMSSLSYLHTYSSIYNFLNYIIDLNFYIYVIKINACRIYQEKKKKKIKLIKRNKIIISQGKKEHFYY